MEGDGLGAGGRRVPPQTSLQTRGPEDLVMWFCTQERFRPRDLVLGGPQMDKRGRKKKWQGYKYNQESIPPYQLLSRWSNS